MVKHPAFPSSSRWKGNRAGGPEPSPCLMSRAARATHRAVGMCGSLCPSRVLHQGVWLMSLTKVDGGGQSTSVHSGRVQNDRKTPELEDANSSTTS